MTLMVSFYWLTTYVFISLCEIWCITRRHTYSTDPLPHSLCLYKSKSTRPPRAGTEWVTAGAVCVCVCVSSVRPSLVGPHAAALLSADGCCRIQAPCAPLQMCQISSSILLSLPDAHTRTADAPLRLLDTQLSVKVAHHPQRYVNCFWKTLSDVCFSARSRFRRLEWDAVEPLLRILRILFIPSSYLSLSTDMTFILE